MGPKLVDLSIPLEAGRNCQWPGIKLRHQSHKRSRWLIRFYLKLPFRLLRNRLGWANDRVTLSSHSGTHLDAPWHYGPLVEGKKARTIDEIPLEWCYGDGVVIDVRHRKTGELIESADLEAGLKNIPYTLKHLDIVLIHTGMSRFYGSPEFFQQGPGMSRDATRYLLARGVRVIGIDAWGFDLPLRYAARKARATNDVNFFWQSHFAGLDHEYCHIEQLTNLAALPSHDFKITCFPVKLKGGSAAWCRVIAIINT